MVLNQIESLTTLTWDYVIFDEGQKIKDPLRKISKSVKELRSVNKLLLSGTPIQNNLKVLCPLGAILNLLNNIIIRKCGPCLITLAMESYWEISRVLGLATRIQ